MIVLDTTTRSLEIDLNGAVTTNQLPFVASYVDMAKTTMELTSAATNASQTNSTTAVTLVAAPGANQTRQLKYLSVRNADTVATLLWIQLNDNSTLREIWKGTLAVGDTLVYTDSLGFNVVNSSGQIKTGSGISSIGASTDNALVRWDGTGGTAIQNSGWTLADTDVLTAGSHLALGANYISRAGTAAGLSLDASNNATLSGKLTINFNGAEAVLISAANPDISASRVTATTGTNAAGMVYTNTGGNFFVGRDNSTGGRIGGVAYAAYLWNEGNQSVLIGVNNALAATFATTGLTLAGTLTVSGASATVNGNAVLVANGINFGPSVVTSITVVNGQITAIS